MRVLYQREKNESYPGWYQSSRKYVPVKRNVVIDVLRGYCILMMITSHVSVNSYVNGGVHLLRFVSGAEGFVFLSGLVLGLVYRHKLAKVPSLECYKRLWRRALTIWTAHCLLVISALFINRWWLHLGDIPNPYAYGIIRAIWFTLILKIQPAHLLNILPLYVVLLALTPAVLWLLENKQTIALLFGSIAIFGRTQWEPGLGHWVLASSGGDAFPAFSWQLLFVSGITVGWHYEWLRSKIVSVHRSRLFWGLGIVTIITMVLTAVQTPTFQFYNHESWDLYLWERHPLRFGRILFFFESIGFFYLAAQRWMDSRKLPKWPMEALAVLGRNSLYCFIVHIIFCFLIAKVQFPPESWIPAEIMTAVMVGAVYLCAKHKVARKWIPN